MTLRELNYFGSTFRKDGGMDTDILLSGKMVKLSGVKNLKV